jgi:hypothetical protein
MNQNSLIKWLLAGVAAFGLVVVALGALIGAAWLRARGTRNPENSVRVDIPPLNQSSYYQPAFFMRTSESSLSDMVVMNRDSSHNLFTLSGELQSRQEGSWQVAGQNLQVGQNTPGAEEVKVGDLVSIQGEVQDGNRLAAERVSQASLSELSFPFDLTGILESQDGILWTISGADFVVTQAAQQDDSLEAGDVVDVQGITMVDGTWIATSVQMAEDQNLDFGFQGHVQSMDPWKVAGRDLSLADGAEVESGIVSGSLVQVQGHIQQDGLWVADQITLVQTGGVTTVVLVGTVDSLNPLVVNGITLVLDQQTVVEGNLEVGMLVRVEIELRSDGTWMATYILPLASQEQPACLTYSDVVVQLNDGQIILLNSPAIELNESIQVQGEIQPGSVLLIEACTGEQGALVIQSITVIHQIEEPVVTPPPGEEEDQSGKVTICHIPPGNPANRHTITIDRSALEAHINNHGDTLGPCP